MPHQVADRGCAAHAAVLSHLSPDARQPQAGRKLRGLPQASGAARMKTMRALIILCALAPFTSSATAQSLRGSVNSLARYIEVRTMTRDTVARADVVFGDDSIPTFEGRPVFCSAATCTFYRPGDVEHAVAAAHDVSFTTWGFGLEGLSGTVYLRSRPSLGGDFTWPRSDDAFDAILPYAALVRERYRVRLGRQPSLTGLGS